MVGGGVGGFFGAAHRIACRIDDRFELVAGAFSSDPSRNAESGASLGIDPQRCYDSFEQMAEQEAARADGIEAVAVVTPNFLHHPAARAFLDNGIHVMCDKPLTTTLEDALDLRAAVTRTGLAFAVTYTNAGFGMVREARRLVLSGELGRLRVVQAEFPQEWLATAVEAQGNKQAVWRTDPQRSGKAGSLGDIGTHAFHLVEYVTGLAVEQVAAQVDTFVDGRRVDDNVNILMRLDGGATGMLWASQIAIGNTNGCRIRVYCETGSIEWTVEAPNQLKVARNGEAYRIIERASSQTTVAGRMPPGHPEGFLEALGQLYCDFADQIRSGDRSPAVARSLLPNVEDGVRGLYFIEAALLSGQSNAQWVPLSDKAVPNIP